jgi:hypothetical protein
MQNFQAGFELKNFEVGKIVDIGINMRIFLMFERENLKIGYENHTTRLNVLYSIYFLQAMHIYFFQGEQPSKPSIDVRAKSLAKLKLPKFTQIKPLHTRKSLFVK